MAPVALESIYVGAEGRLIRALPPPPTAVEGGSEWERLLAVAEWATEENVRPCTVQAQLSRCILNCPGNKYS